MDLGCLGYGLFGLRNLDTGESRRFELGHWGESTVRTWTLGRVEGSNLDTGESRRFELGHWRASTVRPNPKSHSMDLGCLGYGSFGFGGGANLGVRESMEVLGGVKYGGA